MQFLPERRINLFVFEWMSASAQRLPVARNADYVWGLRKYEEKHNAPENSQTSSSPAAGPKRRNLIYLARYGDAGLPKHMSDLRVPQARPVIFKREPVLAIHAKFAQAIGIREFTEPA